MSESNRRRLPRRPRRGRHRAPQTRRSTLALGLASVLVGAACGGGGGTLAALTTESPAPTVPSATPTPTPTPTAPPVTIPPRAPRPAPVTVAPALAYRVDGVGGSAGAFVLAGAAREARAAQARAARGVARARLGALPGWARPIEPGTRLTSTFKTRWGRHHNGIDLAGPVGMPVRAMSGGVVVFAGTQGGYGNKIEIRHVEGTTAHYGHLDRIRVEEGDTVAAGDLIGALGNTGRSTGPHLHLEVRSRANVPVDPMPWLAARRIMPATKVEPGATATS